MVTQPTPLHVPGKRDGGVSKESSQGPTQGTSFRKNFISFFPCKWGCQSSGVPADCQECSTASGSQGCRKRDIQAFPWHICLGGHCDQLKDQDNMRADPAQVQGNPFGLEIQSSLVFSQEDIPLGWRHLRNVSLGRA